MRLKQCVFYEYTSWNPSLIASWPIKIYKEEKEERKKKQKKKRKRACQIQGGEIQGPPHMTKALEETLNFGAVENVRETGEFSKSKARSVVQRLHDGVFEPLTKKGGLRWTHRPECVPWAKMATVHIHVKIYMYPISKGLKYLVDFQGISWYLHR